VILADSQLRIAVASARCRKADKTEEDDQLSESDNHHLLVASWPPRDLGSTPKGDTHIGILCRCDRVTYRRPKPAGNDGGPVVSRWGNLP
jgi:hypothetical protein